GVLVEGACTRTWRLDATEVHVDLRQSGGRTGEPPNLRSAVHDIEQAPHVLLHVAVRASGTPHVDDEVVQLAIAIEVAGDVSAHPDFIRADRVFLQQLAHPAGRRHRVATERAVALGVAETEVIPSITIEIADGVTRAYCHRSCLAIE